ncbi:MAG: helix-turn-helix domain-containing protein [Candidatus Aenigmatarchaeota archaeon]
MNEFITQRKGEKAFSLPTKIVKPKEMRKALSPLAWKILQELFRKPNYPKQLAKRLNMHEQKIYYHIRNLEKAGLIKKTREESIHGVSAKYYETDKPSFSLVLDEMKPEIDYSKGKEFLSPFIVNGNLNAIIILGSPDPHGPSKVRARDVVYGTELGLFLGMFLSNLSPNLVKLDTEIHANDLKNNLIIIGGPGVNCISAKINESLPIRFIEKGNRFVGIYSSISKKIYPEEECGLIVKAKNPFEREKYLLLIAGMRAKGTKAAIISLLNYSDYIYDGNKYNPKICAKVVEGVDIDSDGIIDKIEIRE